MYKSHLCCQHCQSNLIKPHPHSPDEAILVIYKTLHKQQLTKYDILMCCSQYIAVYIRT